MSSMSIAAFNALPDVTPSMGQELRNINGKLVNVPVMIQPAGALLQRDDDGMFMDPRDGSTWMVGWVDGVRVRRRAERRVKPHPSGESNVTTDLRKYGTRLLRSCAARVEDGIMTGHDWPNTDHELARLQGAKLLRESADEIELLREWAKLAFRVINHVGPLMLTLDAETSAEAEMTDRLREMAEAVATQYPAISGIHFAAAVLDAKEALGEV